MTQQPSLRRTQGRILVSATVALALTAPDQTAGLSVFTEPLIADLGISRTQLSTAYLAATLTGAVCLPLVGRALDRYGVRTLTTLTAVLFGAVLAGCSFVSSLWGLTAGRVGLRLAGQGALGLLATTTVALWFDRRRGTVLGVMSSVGAAGISMTPIITQLLITATDWRTAWLVQGLAIWSILIPIGLYGLRGRPPRTDRHPHPSRPTSGEATGWTVGRAMRTTTFWAIVSAICCQSLLVTAVAFHQVSLLGEHGQSPTQAAANFLPQTLAGLGAILFGSLLGAAGNGIRVLEASIISAYFGTAHLGALRGITHEAAVASTAFGPILLSLGYDLAGSYTPPLILSATAPILIGAAVFLLRSPATDNDR